MQIRLRYFVFGALFLGALLLLGAAVALRDAHGFSARQQPTPVEVWIAHAARSLALPADARAHPNPVPDTADVLAEARAHWADHCANCHANDGSGDTVIGRNTYPPAPDMRLPGTQQKTDGEIFYIIQNGIRLTAMPAWGGGSDHDAQDSWKLVRFIRHLPQLTAAEKKMMETLNPKSPQERKEEEEEERFLNGEDDNEKPIRHEHQ